MVCGKLTHHAPSWRDLIEQLTMSNREIDKLKVIQNTIDGRLTWPQAGTGSG